MDRHFQRGAASMDPTSLYERLAIRDIQDAADLLRPVYDETGRRDGYVSLEGSPLLAADTAGTLAEARRLWAAVGRPNPMIKVPGTPEGIPAIRELIAEAINGNVTLLFAQDAYERAAEAYIAGLEALVARGGEPAPVASVASFFVSRIDTSIGAALEARLSKAARGSSGSCGPARGRIQPGFLSARMFLTGEKIVEHFQWMDRAAYEAYRASDLDKAAASLPVTLHPQLPSFLGREILEELRDPFVDHALDGTGSRGRGVLGLAPPDDLPARGVDHVEHQRAQTEVANPRGMGLEVGLLVAELLHADLVLGGGVVHDLEVAAALHAR
jgi:Transaldolase/Fructose-6-phosphate aldolase